MDRIAFTIFGKDIYWYGVIIATIIGIPLYSNAAGVIPLVSALAENRDDLVFYDGSHSTLTP